MDFKIVADSCCDATDEIKNSLGITTVPLTMTLGETNFTDDEQLNLPDFMVKMKVCTDRIGSASPSPQLYKEAFEGKQTTFVVTLSSKLSGSYNSAMLGKSLAEEDGLDDVHIFDSKSASAGEALVAFKLLKLIDEGITKVNIISATQHFIDNMKTYFVLDNVSNLQKNGRLNKITVKLITALGVKPVLGADGNGNIALFSYARGQKQIIEKLLDTIKKSGKSTKGESMVITHCNNSALANTLKEAATKLFGFADVTILATRGISSMYANDKGIILAF